MQESDKQQPSSIILGSQGENDADQLIPSAIGLLLLLLLILGQEILKNNKNGFN